MSFLIKLKSIFSSPAKPAVSKEDFDKIYANEGLFRYIDDGFIFQFTEGSQKIFWPEIKRMVAYKADLFTYDLLKLDIYFEDLVFPITEDTPGFYQFVLKTKEVFPSIAKDWDLNIIQPPFKLNETIIYESPQSQLKRPFQIKITDIDEVRMGSPYSRCQIELVNFDKIKIPQFGWQDKYAWSDDSKQLLLIKWDFENNDPGFHLFIINAETGQAKESPRIFGLPNSIAFENDKIKINKFLLDKGKSAPGELCCHFDEIIDLNSF